MVTTEGPCWSLHGLLWAEPCRKDGVCLRSLCIWVPAGFPSSGLVLSDGPESALVIGFTVCPATCHKSTFSFSAQPLRQTPCLSFTLLPKLEITVAFTGHSPYLSDKQPAPRSESEPPSPPSFPCLHSLNGPASPLTSVPEFLHCCGGRVCTPQDGRRVVSLFCPLCSGTRLPWL